MVTVGTRIRYTKETNGILTTTKAYVAGSNLVKGQIENTGDSFFITVNTVDSQGNVSSKVLESVYSTNLTEAKKQVKRLLIDLGVQFVNEFRVKTTATTTQTSTTTMEPTDDMPTAA